MSDAIRQYYLLCTQALGGKAHIIGALPRDKITTLFTRKEIELYLREIDGAEGPTYIAREAVVGGDQPDDVAVDTAIHAVVI